MRVFLFLLGIFLFINAADLKTLYKNEKYEYICKNRWKYINKYANKNEKLLSLVGSACLKKRFIIPALDVAKNLNLTKEGRANATYIASMFLIEKILIQILNKDIYPYNISLPVIVDNDLGIVFKEITNGNYKFEGSFIVLYKKGIKYKIYLNKFNNIVIEKDGKKETYW